MRRRTGFSRNSVAVQVGSYIPSHWILPQPISDDAYGRYYTIEDHAEYDSCVDPAQDMPNRHPTFVGPKKAVRQRDGWHEKTDRDYDSPPKRILIAKYERPNTYSGKYATHDQSERSQLIACDLVLHSFTSVIRLAASNKQISPCFQLRYSPSLTCGLLLLTTHCLLDTCQLMSNTLILNRVRAT